MSGRLIACASGKFCAVTSADFAASSVDFVAPAALCGSDLLAFIAKANTNKEIILAAAEAITCTKVSVPGRDSFAACPPLLLRNIAAGIDVKLASRDQWTSPRVYLMRFV